MPARPTPEPTNREGLQPRANERHAVGCCEELARFSSEHLWLRDRECSADLTCEVIWDFCVPANRFDVACERITPELMFFPLTLEKTAVPPQMT